MGKQEYPYYIYLHENGSLIYKSAYVVETNSTPEEYFDSPMVKKWWKITRLADVAQVNEYLKGLQ